MREKIVFLHHSGIGNLVLTTPMLKAIKKAKPTCELIVVTWERSGRILEGVDFIDLLLFAEQGRVIIKNLYPEIDHLILSPVGVIQNMIDDFARMSKHVHNIKIGDAWGKHEAEYHMDFARKLGYSGDTLSPEVKIFEYNQEKVDDKLKRLSANRFFCINASHLKTDHWWLKHWGTEKYAKLLDEIKKIFPDRKFLFVGDKTDIEETDRIIQMAGGTVFENCINMCGFSDDIKDTAALLLRAEICIGNDGGLQHIASAVGIPTVTIFTFTNIIKNRPLGPLAQVAANNCERRIYCQHHIDEIDTCRNNGCLNVSVDKVLQKIAVACKNLSS